MATWVMDSFFALTQILSLNSHRLFQAWQRTGCQWHGLAPTRLRTASLEPFHVVCKHCVTGTFSHVSTFSLAPLFESTLFHGHPPPLVWHPCMRTCTHACNKRKKSTKFGWTLLDWLGTLFAFKELASQRSSSIQTGFNMVLPCCELVTDKTFLMKQPASCCQLVSQLVAMTVSFGFGFGFGFGRPAESSRAEPGQTRPLQHIAMTVG
mgnify:CR=1 FL=1